MRVGIHILAALVATLAGVLPAPAQVHRVGGAISGLVLDAGSGQPIAGAVLLVQPAPVASTMATTVAAPPRPVRSTRSDSAGAYRFDGLPPARYELRTRRIGYREVVLAVEIVGQADARVAVGLTILPIRLEPVTASPQVAAPFAERDPGSPEREARARASAERARLGQSLSVDAHTLTHAAVVQAITTAEPDLFRALHRRPGVTTRDDLSAELWIRGARSDLTRVYFDGVPLFDPYHAFGALSVISPDAVGALYLHPAVAPAEFGEGAAGVVDLRSRAGGGDGRLRGMGEVSLVTARGALDQQPGSGRAAWMIAGRRSHVDRVAEAVVPDSTIPFHFTDVTARLDLALGPDRSLELAGTRISNTVAGEVLGVTEELFRRWGSEVGRATLDLPLRGGRLRTTGAFTRSSYRDTGQAEPTADRGAVSLLLLRGEWVVYRDSLTRWTAGIEVGSQASRYRGGQLIRAHPDLPDSLRYRAERTLAAAWLTRRWSPTERLTLEAMLRADAAPAGPGTVLLAPRGAARYRLAPGLSASVAAGQSFQHTQAITPGAPGLRSEPRAQNLWLLAGDTLPRVRSRVGTAGLEYRNGAWLASGSAFVRALSGLAVAEPAPGELVGRRTFRAGGSRAYGMEASASRLGRRLTLQGGYSYGRSTTTVGGYRYPSPEERTHALDLTAMLWAGRSVRWGAAYTAMAGSPFTPYTAAESDCRGPGPCRWLRPAAVGAPGSGRGPAYSSLDALVDWTGRVRGIRAGAYLQIHNVLNRANDVTYSRECATCEGPDRHRFGGGIGRVPMIGVRAVF